MWRSRLEYLATLLACLVLLFFFDRSLFLWAAAEMAAVAFLLRLISGRDAGKLRVLAGMPKRAGAGQKLILTLTAQTKGKLLAVGSLLAECEITYTMFGVREKKTLCLPFSDSGKAFRIPLNAAYCGEVRVRCTNLWAMDVMQLFRVRIADFPETHAVIDPGRVNLETELVRGTSGAPEKEGLLQNRRGNDRSEIYDIREYVPGDDIRSIHWKLSGKLDQLIVREASDPSHYELLILPDCGLMQGETETTRTERNTAAAVFEAAGEQLCRQGVSFCVGLLAQDGLVLREVRSDRDFEQVLQEWMCTELPKRGGTALKYFLLEHLERHFSRLLILSAGRCQESLQELEGRIGFTVVSAVKDGRAAYSSVSEMENMVEIPADSPGKEVYRILC